MSVFARTRPAANDANAAAGGFERGSSLKDERGERLYVMRVRKEIEEIERTECVTAAPQFRHVTGEGYRIAREITNPRRGRLREQVERVLPIRKGRPLLLVDLAVPRDLDPAIKDLHGCFLYDIDDLQAVVEESLSGRRGEATRAEAMSLIIG